jgi:F420-0:gamma-glutamyl ligase-like protein
VEKKGKTVLKKIFLLHVFLSLFVFWDYGYTIPGNYFTEAVFIAAPTILFFLGQVVFIIGVFKAKVPIVASTASNN